MAHTPSCSAGTSPPAAAPAAPAAASAGVEAGAAPNPLLRNSLADADASAQRKRPRLDSGERALRDLSADIAAATSAVTLESATESSNTGPLTSASHSPFAGEGGKEPLLATPGRMTVSVRDAPSRSSPTPPGSPSRRGDSPSSEARISPAATAPALEAGAREDVPDFDASSSSSPVDSPDIEVAELEDLAGPTGPTVWTRVSGVDRPAIMHNALLHTFPATSGRARGPRITEAVLEKLRQRKLSPGHLLRPLLTLTCRTQLCSTPASVHRPVDLGISQSYRGSPVQVVRALRQRSGLLGQPS